MPAEGCVRVYRFHQAPLVLQKLSQHGGDEDWIVVAPKNAYEDGAMIADKLMVCSIQENRLKDGRTVWITSHA